jgi:glycosyltransferase involved in cell wall biosynthesis
LTPLRVLCLIDELVVWRGTETHLFRLFSGLDPRRIELQLAVVGNCGLAGEFRDSGIPVECLEIFRVFAGSGLRGVGQIVSLLRRRRFDLLVSYHTASDLLAPVAGVLARVPVLSCRRDMGFTKKRFHVRVQRHLNPLVRGMISVSHAVVQEVHRTEGFPVQRCQVIWNGEDLQKFRAGRQPALRRELGLDEGNCVISCVGGLVDVKDHATLIDGFGRVASQYPRARLLIIGAGPEEQALRRRAAPLGQQVRLLGHRRNVPELLRASDIYAQTSTTEGFSNAILQAMATSLPVLATRVGGNPELVTPEVGLMVEAGRPEQVGEALGELIADGGRRQALGRGGRRRAERYGSLPVMVEAYSDAFERTLQGRFPGPSSGE